MFNDHETKEALTVTIESADPFCFKAFVNGDATLILFLTIFLLIKNMCNYINRKSTTTVHELTKKFNQ